jgi:indolepyruvate ferredoxin oxidoreductase beta subunit
MPQSNITNIVVAGLGGQGVLKASDILASTVFRAGFDVKKSEIHGMSQRGGSVSSDVRFGKKVFSPMVPPGAADYLLVLAASQVEVARPMLKAGGVLIEPSAVDESHLDLADNVWHAAIQAALPEKLHAANLQAFAIGKGA